MGIASITALGVACGSSPIASTGAGVGGATTSGHGGAGGAATTGQGGAGGAAEPDVLSVIFDPTGIGKVELDMSPDQISVLSADPEAEQYVHGDFRYTSPSGHASWSFKDVGIRYKGNTSLDVKLGKLPWKVKFNNFVLGQKFGGLKKIGFGTEYGDPTFVRESLAYATARAAGIPAPRTQYVRILVNGVDRGLYLLTEEIDDVFLASHFPDGTGNLYKVTRGPLLYWGDDPEDYQGRDGSYAYDEGMEKNPDFTDLINLTKTFTQSPDEALPAALSPIFDVEGWLDVLAVDTLQTNLDAPAYSANNYYLFHDPQDGRFRVLSWDMDSSFAAFPPTATPKQKAGLDIHNPKLTDDPRPLIDRILGNPTWRKGWLDRLALLNTTVFDPKKLEALVRQTWALIEPEMKTDPILIYGYAAAVTGLDAEVDASDPVRRYPEPFPGLVPFLYERAASVDAQLESGSAPWPHSEPYLPVDITLEAKVDVPAPPGDLYVYVQGHDVSGTTQTFLVRAKRNDAHVAFNTVVSLPSSSTEVTVAAFLDTGADSWIDPDVDLWGSITIALPGGPAITGQIEGKVHIDTPWSGAGIWASKFGAPTGL
ncbi:MAG: CotH kinase family protein [Byssovorax sp.]